MAPPHSRMHVVYLSHTGMTEPLGRSQVLSYVRGLARKGWTFDIVAFEPASAPLEEIQTLTGQLGAEGIRYSWIRRSASHSLLTKFAEAGGAMGRALLRAARNRPVIVHARSYLPAAVAQATARLVPGSRFIFDCRGLLADEYVDAGHWSRTSTLYRGVKRVERGLFRGADGVVSLTHRARDWLASQGMLGPKSHVKVIPCCVDMDHFRFHAEGRDRYRRELRAGEHYVLAYSGTLGSWYNEEQMANLFAAIRKRTPARFAVFSRSNGDKLREHCRRAGVADEDVFVLPVHPSEMPAALSAADGAVAFYRDSFSKIATSPTKIPEYLAVGLPVALNPEVGDLQRLVSRPPIVSAGGLSPDDAASMADRLLALRGRPDLAQTARALADEEFGLATVGVARYAELYEQISAQR
jgi:glycosyltransferase involved in cell wall biosynthesis